MQMRTLGAFELLQPPEAGGARLLGPGKPLALLAYLARLPGRRASRDTLLELLWGNVGQERGRSTLRQTVWSLRRLLGEGGLRSEGEDVALELPLEVDATAFEDDVRAGRLDAAWRRYRGPFVPFFAAPGSATFEQWADNERGRLRALWQATGETLASAALGGGEVDHCLDIARQLRQDDPERADWWAIIISGHLARGQWLQAQHEADGLTTLLARAGRQPDARLARLITATRTPNPPGAHAVSAPGRTEPELVGREAPFSALLEAWRLAERGDGRTVLVRSPAGFGKTRLLRDLGARLSALGAAPAALRAPAADRDRSYSLAGALAESLGNRPGARAVSPASAATLVDLAPALSNRFSVDPPPLRQGEELLRVRISALAELLGAVAEENPLAILVDDLHWSDEQSLAILASLCERLAGQPVLFVFAARPRTAGAAAPTAGTELDLEALTVEHLEELLGSMATGEPALVRSLAEALHTASAGVPLLATAAIELLPHQGQLHIRDGLWVCADPEALRRALARGAILDQALQALPPRAGQALLALALAGRPLAASLLDEALDTADGAALASTLEQRGLAVQVHGSWEPAHERIAEAAVARASAEQRAGLSQGLGRAILAAEGSAPQALRDAGRLLASVDDPETPAVFVRWLAARDREEFWRQPVAAAREFLGATPTAVPPERLAGAVPLPARLRGFWPVGVAVAQACAVAVGALALVAGLLRGPAAAHLRVAFPPTSKGFLWDTLTPNCGSRKDCGTFPVRVEAELRTEAGAPTGRGPRHATVRLAATDGATLQGDTVAPFQGGIARFQRLRLVGQGQVELEVVADGLPAVRSGPVFLNAGGISPRLWLVSGSVAGQPVDSVNRTVIVRPSQELAGKVVLRALTNHLSSSVLLGAVAYWGDRRTNFIPLTVPPSHGVHELQVELEDASRPGRHLVAPATPGRYRLVFVFDAETEMHYIASNTNWATGSPAWNDGNDLVDLPEETLARMDSTGLVEGTLRLYGPNKSRRDSRFLQPIPLAGTSLVVEVRP